jgi:hypothetical protein
MNGTAGGAGLPDGAPKAGSSTRAALWIGLAGVCVVTATTYLVVRAMWNRRPPDETAERIQALIDEANRLIRTLEDKK